MYFVLLNCMYSEGDLCCNDAVFFYSDIQCCQQVEIYHTIPILPQFQGQICEAVVVSLVVTIYFFYFAPTIKHDNELHVTSFNCQIWCIKEQGMFLSALLALKWHRSFTFISCYSEEISNKNIRTKKNNCYCKSKGV